MAVPRTAVQSSPRNPANLDKVITDTARATTSPSAKPKQWDSGKDVAIYQQRRAADAWDGVVARGDRPNSERRMSLNYGSLRPKEKALLEQSDIKGIKGWNALSDHEKGSFKLLVRMLRRNGIKLTGIPGLKISFGKANDENNPKRAINMHLDFGGNSKEIFEKRVRAAAKKGHVREGQSDKHGARGDKAIYRDVDAWDHNGRDMFGTQIGIGKGDKGFVDVDKYTGSGPGGGRRHKEYDSPQSDKYVPADPRLVGGLLRIGKRKKS